MMPHPYPQWAKTRRRKNALTEVEQERVRLNAHIPLDHLACLMNRDRRTLQRWARANGIPKATRGWQRVKRIKKPQRAVAKIQRLEIYTESDWAVARLVSLAHIASLSERREMSA